MSQSKLFDYNSSFSVLRTNPKLSGNFKITVDSNNGVWFNSIDANPTLSDSRFKKFNITGEHSFSQDLFNFFDQGKTSKDLIFELKTQTNGDRQTAEKFSGQYDFFYGSGASILIDKNYKESFKYFAPLWIKNEIPDFFVIFKVPGPLSYPYAKNITSIENGKTYKVVQDYATTNTERFTIIYGKDANGNSVYVTAGQTFKGNSNYTTYRIARGEGKVVLFEELQNLSSVNDAAGTFSDKILPNCTIIKTFDLRADTKIGKYIRSIFNNPMFSKSPLEVSWGSDSYSYFKGVSYSEGIFTKKGESLNPYLTSSKSDPMMDLEEYLTSGFYRNGIICPNLLNLEFIFDDTESDLYTINRYMGFYVSRNDIANFRLNGDFFYKYKGLEGNGNYPQPSRNNIGYYYNNYSTVLSATSGIRLFYEEATGFLPGSDNVNLYDPNKIFYITDKNDNFYSLKRSEDYTVPGGSGPDAAYYSYGPFDSSLNTFSATGSTASTSGSLVIGNTSVDLFNFTGSDDSNQKIATVKGANATIAGRAYIEIEFLKQYDFPDPLTFKIFWPNGSQKEGSRKYDIIRSGDFSSILIWVGGSTYSTGIYHYFNSATGTLNEIATAFANLVKDIDEIVWDSGSDAASSIIRVKNEGLYGDESYSVSVFDDYTNFLTVYKGNWSNTKSYSTGDVVIYNNRYYTPNVNIPAPPTNSHNISPEDNTSWNLYSTFNKQGYVKINGTDVNGITSNVHFVGASKTKNSRLIFSKEYSNQVKAGSYIDTTTGHSKIMEITKYVDEPIKDPDSEQVVGFNNFNYYLVANLEDQNAIVKLGSDKSFNVYSTSNCHLGVFTFFDIKEFDFDFWSSDYGYTPNPETYRYFQLQSGKQGIIDPGVPYFVKYGQINYNGVLYSYGDTVNGDIFYGVTGATSFTDVNPGNISPAIVFPAQYSSTIYNSSTITYGGTGSGINYYKDLRSFAGFLGIQDLSPDPLKVDNSFKEIVFENGKLKSEYQYLRENYTIDRSNKSRIVPYINKWGYGSGFDARGNKYRLNSSPAFTPLNFSPSLEQTAPDPKYMTQEWFLLEQPPIHFPKEFMNDQNSYLPGKIDIVKAKSADPNDSLYLSSYFTVEPEDYTSEFRDTKFYTKELFSSFNYNPASGYYETLFRGIKIVLKKRSSLSSANTNSLDRYIPNYRSYEDYKFSAILRAVPEDSTTIQAPVKYDIIENPQQKFILFVCDVVVKDQRVFELGYTGGTGGNPALDYTTLYSLTDKTKITYPLVSGQGFSSIDDIKLSVALDLSISSGSLVDITGPGKIYSVTNPYYDTDLREEIHKIYVENSIGLTGPSPTGIGSFSVPSINSTYPWPIGVGPSYIELGRVQAGADYTFTIPFSSSSPVTVPVGPASIYKTAPVFQKGGGEGYYGSILARCTISYIASRINARSPYINYNTYLWDSVNSVTTTKSDSFELYIESPTKIVKTRGTSFSPSYSGPQELRGNSVANSYVLNPYDSSIPSILLRYSGGYEPITRKVLHFNHDKTDTIFGSDSINLSFRNCNFSPEKLYFGISRNLSYTKVSLGSPILSLSSSFPEGAVYPLINQTPIAKKDFNVFSSSWDPGYYQRYIDAKNYVDVAGTRSMNEFSTFFGSKMMQTPDPVYAPNYITLEISRTRGNNDVGEINALINASIKSIQSIDKSNSGIGIGSAGPYLSGVDYNKLDQDIFPNAEIIWQYFPETMNISGIIRLDRVLRRCLLNGGIKQVFLDNMISDFGYGDPNSIDDDVNNYIDVNISTIYQGQSLDLFVNKAGNQDIPISEGLRGDIATSERYKLGYFPDPNFKLTQSNNLIYSFNYPMEKGFNYSLLFDFVISKI
jgi:hypothetical protein